MDSCSSTEDISPKYFSESAISRSAILASSASLARFSSWRLARTCGGLPFIGGIRCILTSAFWIMAPNFSSPALGTTTTTLTGSLPEEETIASPIEARPLSSSAWAWAETTPKKEAADLRSKTARSTSTKEESLVTRSILLFRSSICTLSFSSPCLRSSTSASMAMDLEALNSSSNDEKPIFSRDGPRGSAEYRALMRRSSSDTSLPLAVSMPLFRKGRAALESGSICITPRS